MKRLMILMSFVVASIAAMGQCELENGDFETYVDLSASIDSTGTIPEGTILFPEGFQPYLRILLMAFESLTLEPGTEAFTELWSHGLGISRSEEAHSGQYALRIGADASSETSDLLQVIACDKIPTYIKFHYRHVGDGRDSLTLIALADEGYHLEEENYRLVDAAAGVIFQFTAQDTVPEYQEYKSTYQLFNEKAVDTLVTFFLLSGNAEDIAAGKESYFLIDGLELNFQPSGTQEDFFDEIKLYPSPVKDRLAISVPVDMKAVVIDGSGRKYKESSLTSEDKSFIQVNDLPAGTHYVSLLSPSGKRYIKPFLKL